MEELGTLQHMNALLANGSRGEVVGVLEVLEEALHHVDLASAFASSFGGLDHLNALLRRLPRHREPSPSSSLASASPPPPAERGGAAPTDPELQAHVALVLGICFSNNPIAQGQPQLRDTLQYLLALLLVREEEQEQQTHLDRTHRLLYALSSAVRSHAGNTGILFQLGGAHALLGVAERHAAQAPHVTVRVLGLLLDSLDARLFPVNEEGAGAGDGDMPAPPSLPALTAAEGTRLCALLLLPHPDPDADLQQQPQQQEKGTDDRHELRLQAQHLNLCPSPSMPGGSETPLLSGGDLLDVRDAL
jgi:hypothetical protein